MALLHKDLFALVQTKSIKQIAPRCYSEPEKA